MKKKINFEDITLRKQISSRGGGIEIALDSFGFFNEKMAAYQNYLGGGILGRICVNDTVRAYNDGEDISDHDNQALDQIGEQLMQYFHELTNPDSEWEGMTFDENQNLPISGF